MQIIFHRPHIQKLIALINLFIALMLDTVTENGSATRSARPSDLYPPPHPATPTLRSDDLPPLQSHHVINPASPRCRVGTGPPVNHPPLKPAPGTRPLTEAGCFRTAIGDDPTPLIPCAVFVTNIPYPYPLVLLSHPLTCGLLASVHLDLAPPLPPHEHTVTLQKKMLCSTYWDGD
eukprot:757849-Hanusia_phi.AAC.2